VIRCQERSAGEHVRSRFYRLNPAVQGWLPLTDKRLPVERIGVLVPQSELLITLRGSVYTGNEIKVEATTMMVAASICTTSLRSQFPRFES
jgi:hypothetical protein